MERFLPPQMAILRSDYRFCEYRLRLLERHPAVNQASIAAIVARMARIAAECPDIRTHSMGEP